MQENVEISFVICAEASASGGQDPPDPVCTPKVSLQYALESYLRKASGIWKSSQARANTYF